MQRLDVSRDESSGQSRASIQASIVLWQLGQSLARNQDSTTEMSNRPVNHVATSSNAPSASRPHILSQTLRSMEMNRSSLTLSTFTAAIYRGRVREA